MVEALKSYNNRLLENTELFMTCLFCFTIILARSC